MKVDAKTKTLLEDYKKNKKVGDSKKTGDDEKENGEVKSDEEGEVEELDEFTQREDRVAKAGLDAIMWEYAEDLAKIPPSEAAAEAKKERKARAQQLQQHQSEQQKKLQQEHVEAVCSFLRTAK